MANSATYACSQLWWSLTQLFERFVVVLVQFEVFPAGDNEFLLRVQTRGVEVRRDRELAHFFEAGNNTPGTVESKSLLDKDKILNI